LHEAIRDLVRARHAACRDVRRARIRIQAFLLRNDLRFVGKAWSHRHRMWLCNCGFAHPAQQIAFQTYLNALEYEEKRKFELEAQIKEAIELSPWSGLVRALQALKGVGPIVAATIVAEVGDFTASPIRVSSSPISGLPLGNIRAAAASGRAGSPKPEMRPRAAFSAKQHGITGRRQKSGGG